MSTVCNHSVIKERVCINQKQWLDISPPNHSLAQVISDLALEGSNVAVAVNNTVISRSKWDQYIVRADDNISVFSAIAGG